MKFILCTQHFGSLGFAMMLKAEGHEVLMACEPPEDLGEKHPEDADNFFVVGEGIIERQPMSEVFRDNAKYRGAYWIFDSNHLFAYADKLRALGHKVFGTSALTHRMENDRDFGMDIAKKAGFNVADSQQFSDIDEAIQFLEANEDKAYVCKPNNAESHMTYVPAEWETSDAANKELRSYLPCLDTDDFILQEKIKGIEVNIEAWFYKGVPYFSWVDLECKRKNSGDKGELAGGSQEIGFITEMDNGIVTRIMAKMFPFFRSKQYTGFGDVNVILADNEIYFVEYCCRMGYLAHINLFTNLCIAPVGETFAAMIDGKTQGFYERFRKGFGAAILMYLDHAKYGFPLYVSRDIADSFFHYDSYQDEGCEDDEQDFRLAGYGYEAGVICGYGFTPKTAAKDALDKALKVNYPLCAYREDLDEDNYPQSPIRRHEALNAMGLIHRHL